MGTLAQTVGRALRAQSPENPSTSLGNPAQWLVDWFTGGGQTYTGIPVNELNAVRATTVFRCISIIANTVASLPWNVYRRTRDGGRELAADHPVQRLLHDQPNPVTSSYTFRQILVASLLTNGNGYAVIGRSNANRVLDLLQFPPQNVSVDRKGEPGSWRLEYEVRAEGKRYDIPATDMIHVPGLGFDGVKGISVIAAVGRQSIGLALALEEFQARIHANAARPSGVVQVDKSLSTEALANLRAAFEGLYGGREKVGKTVFLDKGMTWQAMQIDPNDAQTLESRRFQVTDICRIYGVPPHLVGEVEKSTSWGTGIEQQTIGFVEYVIRPWLVSIEQEFNRKLFATTRYFCEFGLEGLLRGDSKARADFYAKAIQNAWMKPNEVRRRENLPRDPDGDRLLYPRNLGPLDRIDEHGNNPGGSNDVRETSETDDESAVEN
jgi:HK97 family phage portal protein